MQEANTLTCLVRTDLGEGSSPPGKALRSLLEEVFLEFSENGAWVLVMCNSTFRSQPDLSLPPGNPPRPPARA